MKTAKNYVELAKAWKGKNTFDGSHKMIIDVYNSFQPHPRGYKVAYTDSWCATFVSAVSVQLGYTDIIPPECSCYYMTEQFKKLGCFIENENRVPNIGDLVFFDWNDNGTGDDMGIPRHVAIVTNVSRETFSVIEGNWDGKVNEREFAINARYLRGFAVPKYDKEPEKDYDAIGRLLEQCINDTENLESYKKLFDMVGR